MTTIVTCGAYVAADGRVVSSGLNIETDAAVKIFRVGKAVVGTRGDWDYGEKFLEWMRGGVKPRPAAGKTKEFFQALVVRRGKILLFGPDLDAIEVCAPVAIGSGAGYALAAMGADDPSVFGAIEAAAKFDPWTGGNITTLKVP